jgi:threonine/homoserine/homoserine lactone efflux protein
VQALSSSRSAALFPADDGGPRRLRVVFWLAFLSDVPNPKVGVFFLAFLPQFVDPGGDGRTRQPVLLGVAVCVIALPVDVPLVFVASRVSERLRRSGGTAHSLTRLMGAAFIAIGLQAALT